MLNKLMIYIFPFLLPILISNPLSNRIESKTPIRGVPGDGWADVVIGQPDFSELSPNEVTGNRIFNGGGVIIDRSVRPNRLYAYDGGNSRVLGLDHLGICKSGEDIGQKCTTHSDCTDSTCSFQTGRAADIVIGQPDFSRSACNGDSNYQHYPERATANANTLCSMPEDQISPLEGGSFANMDVDQHGNLFIPDFDNHRVLMYISPFTTDTIADAVWGQIDFSGNKCNEGRDVGSPDDDSLCYRSPYNEGFVGGLDIDDQNNLWIADNQNNRVLRFIYDPTSGLPSKKADLVLGQYNFITGDHGTDLNKMFAPAAVRVDSTGRVYVADSLNNRILIFDPPLTTGMAASSLLGGDLSLNLPASLEFDLQGNLWVSDAQNFQLLHFNLMNGQVDRVLFKDVPNYTGQCGGSYIGDGPDFYFPDSKTYMNSYNVCDSRGSIGIDIDGNVFISASSFTQDVWRFPVPFPVPTPGLAHSADLQVFRPYIIGEHNHVSGKDLFSPRGIAIAAGQIIISDGGRILFWNNAPSEIENGQAADGAVGSPNFNLLIDNHFGPIDTDENNHLWVLQGDQIKIYQLPLVTGQNPIKIISPPLAVQGGGSIGWGDYLTIADLAVNKDSSNLWLSNPWANRVLRIRNPLTNPIVDIILGQTSINNDQCNQGLVNPNATTLCYPGHVSLDQNGNLFVSDHSLEVNGNHRLLEFDSSLFPTNPSNVIFAIPANRVYGTNGSFTGSPCQDALCGPWETAFDSTGKMFVGLNGYLGTRFPLFYNDPLNELLPSGMLEDYYSMAYTAHVDKYDTLYIGDLNRGRVLIYYLKDPVNTFSITGKITDGNEKPIRDVDLQVINYVWKGISDLSGQYIISGVTPGYYEIQPSKANCNFNPSSRKVTITNSDLSNIDFLGNCQTSIFIPMVIK